MGDGRQTEGVGPVARRLAANLRELRDSRGLTTIQLADVLRRLGRPILATGITRTEAATRRVDVDDLVALALALDVTPNRLLLADASGGKTVQRYPGDEIGQPVDTLKGESVDLTPGVRVPLEDAWAWATGDRPLAPEREISEVAAGERARAFHQENRPHAPAERYFDKAELRKHPELVRQAAALVRAARQAGVGLGLLSDFLLLADMTLINGHGDPATASDQPVVAAIVTSGKRVLVTARKDGRPPWGFVAGEVEPGEQPGDAAVREVKEETGLEVRAGEVIGERVHPATGRAMIYLATRPVRGTRPFVGDESELSAVRWASFNQAVELLPDMFEPVRDYLARTIGAR